MSVARRLVCPSRAEPSSLLRSLFLGMGRRAVGGGGAVALPADLEVSGEITREDYE